MVLSSSPPPAIQASGGDRLVDTAQNVLAVRVFRRMRLSTSLLGQFLSVSNLSLPARSVAMAVAAIAALEGEPNFLANCRACAALV